MPATVRWGMAQSNESTMMTSCARCGGRFPGPGVERGGKVYCCDKCAEGPNRASIRKLAMALLPVGSGFVIDRFLIRH